MNSGLSSIIEYFKTHDWHFTQDEERPVLRMGFSGENGEWRCVAVLERDETQFAFYSFIPGRAPAKLRTAISELVTRINYGLFCGSFEMDWCDGEIRMKTSVLLYGDDLPDETIHTVVGLNLATVDNFFPAFMKVLYSDATPEEAIEKAEQEQETRSRFELN